MIACYAWSNLMILNAMNIKLNYFPNEEMDIYIRMAPGISREIIATIKQKGVFANVLYTNVPSMRVKMLYLFKKKVRLGWIRFFCKYKTQYHRMLNNLVAGKKYDVILVAGFWNDSLYYIDYFIKANPKLKIELYDEGGITYDNPKRNLCRYYCNKNIMRFRERAKRFAMEKVMEIKYRSKVQNNMYLYSPERYTIVDPDVKVSTIPAINNNNNEMYTFFQEDLFKIYGDLLLPYHKRKVYFIANGNSKWIPDCEQQSKNVIEKMMENITLNNIIIKAHPNNTNNLKKFASEYEDKVYVDRNNILLEFIYPNVDIEKKLLVTYASSSAMFAKTIFGKEPYIILIFRLFHQYHEHGDNNAERYADDLKKMYIDKNKVYIPNTIDEFIDNLIEVMSKIIDYA